MLVTNAQVSSEFKSSEPVPLEDVIEAHTIKNIQISPNGVYYIYVLGKNYKVGTDGYQTSLWLGRTAGGSTRQLTSGEYNDWSPVWSPDSQHILFLSDRQERAKTSNLYQLSLQGGEPIPLTKLKKGVRSPMWSPNGRYVAFASADEPSAADKEREENKDDADVEGENLEFARLQLLNVRSKDIQQLTYNDFDVVNIAWSGNGKQLLFSTREEPNENSSSTGMRIQTINIDGSDLTCVFEKKSSINSIGYIGDEIAYTAPTTDTTNSSVSLWKLTNGAPKRILAGDHNCVENSHFGVSTDGMAAVGIADNLICGITLVGDEPTKIHLEDKVGNDMLRNGYVGGFHVRITNQTVLVLTYIDPHRPMEIWVARGEGDKLTAGQITHHNDNLLKYEYGSTERMKWVSSGKTDVYGVMIRPTSGKAPYPTILHVHGGPYGRVGLEFQAGALRWGQVLAQRGYLVLLPNYRGSSGRGEHFASLVRGAVGTGDWDDCMSMVDAAIDRGLADSTRLGIGGWSQGGFMTAWTVSQTNRFKAAIMGAGISDWSMMAGTSDMAAFQSEIAGSPPWVDLEKRKDLSHSPLTYMTNPKTPTLILHGREDVRVPHSQATMFYRAMKAHKATAKLVTYPREPHGPQERLHQMDILKRVIDWFEKYV
ncbi:hypothetical protein INT43_008041 [Umbelopsis isabellina]|uniref:Dipeptidyl-peptidase V n=1 Tax=Mortierella isabellina TaxID=91625 RepID=A0A8H7PE28_MORIS|nr:hypothetical protein INT43_008041 [Umbelopsis isabellina]